MSSAGGGGINLPPLNQQIFVQVNGANAAQGMFSNVIKGAGGASSAVNGLTGQVGGMNRSMLSTIPTWRGAGDAMRMTGSLMNYQVAMPLMKIGKAAITASKDFETSMSLIKGLVGVGTKDIKTMGDAVLKMAGNVGKAPGELADALYFITSAGITDTTEALNTLDASAKAAAAGLGSVQAVADLSTSVMGAYAPGMYSAAIATDILVAAVREGKAEASAMAPAMGKVLPVAAAFGVKFQDAAASVAALTRQGAPAGTAAIQLRQILASLLKPTAEAREELSRYGISAETLRETIQSKGLFAGFEQLKGALGDNAVAMAKVFGNVRPLTAINALLGPSMKSNAMIFREIGASAGDANKAFEVAQETLGYKMNAASAQGKVALIQVGDAISPVIKLLADLGKSAANALTFFSQNDWLVRTAAGFAGAAIGMTIFIKSLATFIRLKAFTTVALQAMANGFRDQTTGMITNIITGKQYSQTMAMAGASATNAGAAASAGANGYMQLAAGMNAAGGAGAGASGGIAATGAAAAATNPKLITMGNTLRQNVTALLLTKGATVGATGKFTLFQMVVGTAKLAIATFTATMGKALLMMGGMMAGMMVVTYVIGKAFSMFKKFNEPVVSATEQLRGLKDELSDFVVAPIVIGVGIEYNYSGSGLSDKLNAKTDTDKFRDFLLPRDEEGKIKKEAKSIEKEIDNIRNAVMSKDNAMSGALAMASEFGGNAGTRQPAIDYFAQLYGVDAGMLASKLAEAEKSGTKLIEAKFAKVLSTEHLQKFLPANVKSFGDYAKHLFTPANQQASNFGRAMETAFEKFPDFVNPVKDSLDSTNGSVTQFAMSMKTVYDETLASTGSVEHAEAATVAMARAAFKATGGNTKGATVLELMANNSGKYSTALDDLTIATAQNTNGTKASEVTTSQLINTFEKNGTAIKGVTRDTAELSNITNSLNQQFKDGLNPAINDVATIMDAYQEALKGVKRGQDALYSSQINSIDTEIAYSDAISNTITKLKESGGELYSGTKAALESKKALADMAQAAIDVGNAAYENAPSGATADERAALASVAFGSSLDAAKSAIVSKGGITLAEIDKFFTESLGKTIDATGERVAFNQEWYDTTLSADTINTTAAAGGENVGDGVVDGLGNAVDAGKGKLQEIAKDSAQAIIDAYKERLKIKSPSQVMRDEIGMPIPQGIAKGIKDGTSIATGAATALVKDIWAAMDSGEQNASVMASGAPSSTIEKRAPLAAIAAKTAAKARAIAAAKAAALAAGVNFDDIASNVDTSGTSSKSDDTEKLAKTIKLKGKGVSKGVYDLMATTLAGKNASDLGGKFLTKFAEGVNAAKSLIKTPITDLLNSIMSEVSGKLSKITALVNAKINLDQAKVDLKKFLVMNTTEMLQASVNAATRAKNVAASKFGGNQGIEVTKYEKSQIASAAQQAQQAARDYRLGKISFAEYQDAQDNLAETQAKAGEASTDLATATNDLTDAEALKDSAVARQTAAALNVVTAQDGMTAAYVAANTAGVDLAETLAGLALTAIPKLATATVNYFTGLAAVVPAGVTPDLAKLVEGANTEATAGNLVNAPAVQLPADTTAAQMDFNEGRRQFLAIVNKQFEPKPLWKNVSEYVKAGKGAASEAARQARWEKFMVDNNVAAKARGGSLTPGRLTLVGESGPELITSRSASKITPYSVLERYARTAAHDAGNGRDGLGSNPINITVNNPVPERASDSIARRMQNMSSLGLFA